MSTHKCFLEEIRKIFTRYPQENYLPDTPSYLELRCVTLSVTDYFNPLRRYLQKRFLQYNTLGVDYEFHTPSNHYMLSCLVSFGGLCVCGVGGGGGGG